MKPLADGLFQLSGFPSNMVNIYLADDVLIDSGTPFDRRRLFRQLEGRTVRVHALTHAHPDHQGCSLLVHDRLGIPVWAGEADADAVITGDLRSCMPPRSILGGLVRRLMSGPACPVDRRLKEGDTVGTYTVIETPGHTPGHLAFWREADRTLILGDVLANMTPFPNRPNLHEPPPFFTPDPALNRASARKLAALEPALICFGHGPPCRDTAKFVAYASSLKI